jgi:hypothetical protein
MERTPSHKNPQLYYEITLELGFATPALFFRTEITVLKDLRTGIPVPKLGLKIV